MEFTTQEISPIAKDFANLFAKKLSSPQARRIDLVEHELRKALNAFAVIVLSETLKLSEREREACLDCECGGVLSYQRRREAKFESSFGWVPYSRDYYSGCTCKKGKSPLDEEYGIVPGEITPELARLLALAGVELPYRAGKKLVSEFLLLDLSDNSLREESQRFGIYQSEREEKMIEKSQDEAYLQKREHIEAAKKHPERRYGSLDGAFVRIEDPAEEEDWREVKVGSWFDVEVVPSNQRSARHRQKEKIGEQALRAINQQYYCDILKADEFAPLFWATGCQAKVDFAKELVFLGDGAKWIWRLVEHYYPKATQIVDWFHAEERLEKVAKDAFPQAAMRDRWFEKSRAVLWAGEVEAVIQLCKSLAKNSTEAQEAQTYFSNNKKRMRYDEFREKDYMIGSGTIESACKQIVSQRLRCSGAQWKVDGARLIAKARAAWLSNNNDWKNIAAMRAAFPIAA